MRASGARGRKFPQPAQADEEPAGPFAALCWAAIVVAVVAALVELEPQAAANNQDLKAAAARVQQSRASLQAARSDWFPKLDAGFGPTRETLSSASQFLPQSNGPETTTLWRAQGTVSYETDLFGRVGSNVTATQADAQQSEALFRF